VSGYYRWIMMALAIAMLPVVIVKSLFYESLIMFVEAVGIALVIDMIAMKGKIWYYPRQKFLSKEYFGIVLPAWGIFGISINLIWPYLGGGLYSLAIIALSMFVFYEIPNIKTGSWHYKYSLPIVFLGWFPLVATFRLTYLSIPLL